MKRILLGFIVVAVLISGWSALRAAGDAPRGKLLIILQAGQKSPEGLARALHALLYARELKEQGYAVVLVFDGAGTEWAAEWSNPESANKYAPMYRELAKLGVTEVICDYCAAAFGVRDPLQQRKLPLVGEFEGHPSIARWVNQGYQLVVL